MKYNPALDGLRAVAIPLVILTHSFGKVFPGGWIGVDVFFVLSGYLITSILLRELEQTADISMFNFYRRRFLRLTPPLLTLAAFQFAHAALSPHNGAEIVKATLIGMSYTENFNIAFPFGPGEFMKHTWSLATEEQFYLLWPLALPFIVSRRPLVWLACGSAGRLAWSIWLLIHGATLEHIKYGADSRPIGLLVGCALAFIPAKRWPTIPPALAFGLVAALFAVSAAGHDAMIAAPVCVSLATVAIIIAAQSGGAFARAMSAAPIVYVGKISYGLYLYSYPICSGPCGRSDHHSTSGSLH